MTNTRLIGAIREQLYSLAGITSARAERTAHQKRRITESGKELTEEYLKIQIRKSTGLRVSEMPEVLLTAKRLDLLAFRARKASLITPLSVRRREADVRWRERNRDKLSEMNKLYKLRNPSAIKEATKKYREKHRSKLRLQHAIYAQLLQLFKKDSK